jgi:O-antigen/teichoic acid export membrane protein
MTQGNSEPLALIGEETLPPIGKGERGEGMRTAVGTAQLLSVQVLGLVMGFAISVVLTRGLGPERYGLYSVAFSTAMWVEISVAAMFRQTTIKFMAEADDWQTTGAALMQTEFTAGLLGGLALVFLAPSAATLLHAPALTPLLRLMGLYIPLRGLSHSQSSILVGRGEFGRAALPPAFYWPVRLALAAGLIRVGLSTEAGIWAVIGASTVEICVLYSLLRLWPFRRTTFPRRRILGYALPLFFNGLGLRLLTRVDLLAVQARGGDAASGHYGAAQNIGLLPFSFLGGALSAPMLSTIARLTREGQRESAGRIIHNTLRFLVCLLPLVAVAAGAADEIVSLLFGPLFLPAAPVLAWLVFAGLALDLVNVSGSLLTAAGRPSWNLLLTAPVLPLALAGHWLLVPRFGAPAAAAVTAVLAVGAALATTAVMRTLWHVSFPWISTMRSCLLAVAAYLVSAAWPAPGLFLLLKLAVLSLAIGGVFLLSGELGREELLSLRRTLPRHRP